MGTARAAARMRAAPSRSSARPTARPAVARGSSRGPATAYAGKGQAPAPTADEPGPLDAVLELQQFAGNRAVVQLLASGAAAAGTPPAGFGAGNRAFTAALARPASSPAQVLQREMAVDTDPKLRVEMLRDAIRFEPLFYRFVIDAGKTTEALSNMTAADGRKVKAQFKAQKGWNLGWIFSAVEQPIEDRPPATNNLSRADRTRMLNLLGGTAIKPAAPAPAPAAAPAQGPEPGPATPGGAETGPAAGGGAETAPATGGGIPAPPAPPAPAPDADAARVAQNRLRVTAASIRSAVQKKDVKTAIALIPASMEERREIDKLYEALYGQTAYMALFTKLPGKHGQRAAALWYDEKDKADRLALEAATEERDKAAKEAGQLEDVGLAGLGDVAKDIRKKGEQKLEAEVKRVASAGDQTTLSGRAASRERLRKIVTSGDPGDELAKKVGLDSDPVLKAIAEGNEADEIGARLARADATKDVLPAEVESAIRDVRSLAEGQADLTIDLAPDTLEPYRPYLTKAIIDGYFTRFKEAFNKTQKRRTFEAMVAGRGGTDERTAKALGFELADVRDAVGQSADYNRNKALLARGGELEEWGELFFALTKKPKDIERVRQILGSKTYRQVQALAEVYANRSGRSLEADLAGTEVEQAMAGFFTGEAREDLQEKRSLLAGGAWDREVAEQAVPRDADAPTREAHLLAAEGDFLFKRLAALERRVLENRGLFAEARDWSGNEEKRILDQVRKDMWAAKADLGKALTPDRGTTWKEGEEGTPLTADLGAARRAVVELRRLEKRMSHAVTIYKESTRKAYEEFVDLVVNAATIAAGLGVTGIWITAIRTTAATVGTKLLMKGNDYTVDEFFADIQGGMAGIAGDLTKLGVKQLVGPYVAAKIMRLARRVGMSKEMYAQVQARIGPLAIRQAEHTYGTAVSNIAQGRDWSEGQGVGERLKGEAIGAMTAPIDQGIKDSRAAAAAKKKAAAGGADAEPVPTRTSADDDAAAAARRTPAPPADVPTAVSGSEPGPSDATAARPSAADDADADVPATPMALPEPSAPHPGRRPQAPLAKPASPPAEAPAAYPTGAGTAAGGATGGPDTVAGLWRTWQQPDTIAYMPAMSRDARGKEVVLSNVELHPAVEAHVNMPGLLSELERTPWGGRIADSIRDGSMQLVIMPSGPEFPFGGMYYAGGKTYIAWRGDIRETVSNAHHEGSHNLDPATLQGGAEGGPSRLGIEAEARAFEYEYNELAGLPPRQPAEMDYRAAFRRVEIETAGTHPITPDNPFGADLRQARIAGDRAMIEAMRRDPERYAVESDDQEQARIASRRSPGMRGTAPVPAGGDGTAGPRPTGAPGPHPTGARATGTAPYQAPPDAGLAGDRDAPSRRAAVLPEAIYAAADRPISKREEAEIARSQGQVKRAIRQQLSRLPNGIDSGHDFEKFSEAIKALRADPDLGSNREILQHAEDVWKAIHDPALIADVVSQIYGEARRRPGAGGGLDPLTRAILRGAAAEGPVHLIPHGVDLGDDNFFEHWIATGRRFLDLDIDTVKHGHTTHLLQGLIVDAAFKRAGVKMTASRFRQLLGGARTTRTDIGDPGNTLWIKMFDGIDGIPTPEIFLPALRKIPGLEKLR